MGIALALAAAAVFGTADFVGGVAARRAGALLVTVISQAAGFVVLLPALLIFAAPLRQEALWWGALAGAAGGLGLLAFFRALERGVMAIVSPVTAVVAAGLPVIAGLAMGERPAARAWCGVACGLLAVILLGWSRREPASGRVLVSVSLAVAAGAGWGVFFICLARAPHDTGLWPLAASRMCSLGLVVAVLAAIGGEWRAQAPSIRLALTSGLLDMSANVLYLLAVRRGDLAVIAVLASLYPAATIMLSFGLLGERLLRHQLAGAGLALAAVGLISAS